MFFRKLMQRAFDAAAADYRHAPQRVYDRAELLYAAAEKQGHVLAMFPVGDLDYLGADSFGRRVIYHFVAREKNPAGQLAQAATRYPFMTEKTAAWLSCYEMNMVRPAVYAMPLQDAVMFVFKDTDGYFTCTASRAVVTDALERRLKQNDDEMDILAHYPHILLNGKSRRLVLDERAALEQAMTVLAAVADIKPYDPWAARRRQDDMTLHDSFDFAWRHPDHKITRPYIVQERLCEVKNWKNETAEIADSLRMRHAVTRRGLN